MPPKDAKTDDTKGSDGAQASATPDAAALALDNATLKDANAQLTAQLEELKATMQAERDAMTADLDDFAAERNALKLQVDDLNATILELRQSYTAPPPPPVPTGMGGIHTEHHGTAAGRASRSAFGLDADAARAAQPADEAAKA